MNLKPYVNIIQRRKWAVILTVIVVLAATALGTINQKPIYTASTTLRVAASVGGSLNNSEYMYNIQLMNTYVKIATSRPVLDQIKTQLGIKTLPDITAEVIPNTELIKITVKSKNPANASIIANTLTDILIAESNKLYVGGGTNLQAVLEKQLAKAESDLEQARKEYEKIIIQTPAATGQIESVRGLLQSNQTTYTTLLGQYIQASLREEIRSSMITVIEPAIPPQTPSQPNIPLNYALGLVIGLMGGLGLAFILENLDAGHTTENIKSAVVN